MHADEKHWVFDGQTGPAPAATEAEEPPPPLIRTATRLFEEHDPEEKAEVMEKEAQEQMDQIKTLGEHFSQVVDMKPSRMSVTSGLGIYLLSCSHVYT